MSLDFEQADPSSDSDLNVFAGLTGSVRDRVFMDTERQIRSLQALQTARITRVERCGSYLDDGHRTIKNWLRAVTNSSATTAASRVAVAQMCADLAQVAAASAGGELGGDQLRVFANLYANDRCRDQLRDWESRLLDHARPFVFHQFATICRRWEANADPDGAQLKHDIARHNRTAQHSQVGAGSTITISGDAISGEICWDVVVAHAQAEYLNDIEDRAARYGDDADNHPLARTHSQRMHDAFVTICLKARDNTQPPPHTADANDAPDAPDAPDADVTDDDITETADTDTPEPARPEPAKSGSKKASKRSPAPEPLVVIHSTAEAALAALVAYFGFDPTELTNNPNLPDTSARMQFCETAGGAPVDQRTLALALLCGQIQRIITDPKGHTINLGRRSRLFTGAARNAVLLNEDRCTNCNTRHPGIQIDHLRSWHDNGPTDQDNAAPNCGPCNRSKHAYKITVTRDHNGWHYWRPDGTEIAPRTPP